MNNKNLTNYHTFTQLITFAEGLEEDSYTLSEDQLNECLASQGVDLTKLTQSNERLLKRLRNRAKAAGAKEGFKMAVQNTLSIFEMRRVLESEGLLVAAKASGTLSDEDIEAMYRLSRSQDEE